MITVSVTDGVGLIELDRQERRNALDVEHCRRLAEAVPEVVADGARAIVVTGAGTSFCSGADFGQVYGEGFRTALYTALQAVMDAPVPVVAAVNGPAIGAGTQLAIAADLRVGAPTAVFGVPTARIGLAVDPWTIRRLEQLAGGGTARSLLLACEQIGVEQAYARGLVDRLGDRDAALALAADLATMAPLTLRYNKLVLNRADLPNGDPELLAAFEACWNSEDLQEGQRARAEKRAPVFTGR
ncbi:enoyl-CoA hydratase [Pseudonocardia thermophila]|uniref:Enoyl-CoA hydratase n=1 Tax=Pseudonocardia thermophila TaxID=1848 RepID=A0A1M6NF78_PSETH|nr:enoyl-CoA hydratase [Pseudonocardia thermophila]SHJ94337.1 enoyl-CoA hydratase [Pseudonocardia thermophila]